MTVTGKSRALMLVFSLLLGVCLFPQGALCSPFADWFHKGNSATSPDLQIDSYTRAIEHWEEADGYRNKIGAYYNRGCAYALKGEYDRAIADFTKTVEMDPRFIGAHHNRATAYAHKGEYENAIADFTRAIGVYPGRADPYFGRGFVYRRKGLYDRAIADYTKAIELEPGDAAAYNNRGYAYAEQGEYYRAVADYTRSIDLDPGNEHPVGDLGEVYFMQGHLDAALAQLEKAISLKGSSDVYLYEILIYKEKQERTLMDRTLHRAEEYLRREIRQQPKEGFNYADLSVIFCEANARTSEALHLAQKAVELVPDYYSHYALGFSYLRKGDLRTAMDNLEKSRKLNPFYTWTLLRLGSAWKAMGNKMKARQIWEEALKVNPRHRLVLSELKKLR